MAHWTHRGAVQAEVQVQALQLRPLVQAFAPELSLPDGRLDLALTLAGTLQQPRGQGQLSLTALQWQKRQLGDIQVTVGLNNMTAQTELRWELQGRSLLEVHSTIRLDAAQALNIQIRSPGVDLDLLGPLSPAVRHSAGLLTLDLNVTGTVRQPQMRGELLLQDGVLELAATGERYKNMQVQVVFAGNRVTIEQMRLESRSGHFQVTGWLEHADLALRQVDIAVSARDFSALHTSYVDAIVSADVAVRGSLQELSATGSITVPSAHLRLDQIPGSGPKAVQPWELTVAGVYGPGPKALNTAQGPSAVSRGVDDPLPFLQADLRLDIPRNVWVQGPRYRRRVERHYACDQRLPRPVYPERQH